MKKSIIIFQFCFMVSILNAQITANEQPYSWSMSDSLKTAQGNVIVLPVPDKTRIETDAVIHWWGPPELDGCGWIVYMRNDWYKASNLPEEYQIDGLQVKLIYEDDAEHVYHCGLNPTPQKAIKILAIAVADVFPLGNRPPKMETADTKAVSIHYSIENQLFVSSLPMQRIQIYNLNGVLLQDINVNGELQYVLSKHSLVAGIYVATIRLQNAVVQTEKIIIK